MMSRTIDLTRHQLRIPNHVTTYKLSIEETLEHVTLVPSLSYIGPYPHHVPYHHSYRPSGRVRDADPRT